MNGQREDVRFGNGSRATLVQEGAGDDAGGLIEAAGLAGRSGRPVLLVCGGADDLRGPPREVADSLLGPAIATAAALTGATVVDGGTAAGVMLLTGAARAAAPTALPVLVGVAPSGEVTYPGASTNQGVPLEPHHTHFVLANSPEWGGETELMVAIAAALAASAPVAMVLAGGGAVAKAEALHAVRRGWPVFVIAGTGGIADEIVAARGRPARSMPDPALRRIATEDGIRPFAGTEPRQFARRIAWYLQEEPVLKDAWRAFATYDGLAVALRRTFERFQRGILALGVLATLLALLDDTIGAPALHWSVVAAPILISVLIALASRRAAGKRWVVLRGAAESVKSEIYRYRTRTGVYADDRLPGGNAAQRPRVLAAQLDGIDAGLMQTEASAGALPPYAGPLPPEMYGSGRDDDGLSPLDASRYLEIRIGDQLNYYRARVGQLDRLRGVLQALAVLAGGSGAILAAAGAEIWIGLTTAISGGALAYLGYLQVDNTVVAYNQSASKLARLEREWSARDPQARDPAGLSELVVRGEAVLTTELGGWVQQMSEALDELQAQQAEPERRADAPNDASR